MRNTILQWARRLGLMRVVDKLVFYFQKTRLRSRNRQFLRAHPGTRFPPAYMLYEAYRADYEQYFNDGRETARWLTAQWKPFVPGDQLHILDWGCGPARVARHLPELLPGAEIHGSDYNEDTIAWCSGNIPGVTFHHNQLAPPTKFEDNFFDVVYGLSVFTHLSECSHFLWMDELHRIIKNQGILLLTTQGDSFTGKLDPEENKLYDAGRPVIRGHVLEGHRAFSAFEPPAFMQALFSKSWKVLKWIPGTIESWGPAQDTWIVQKV